MDYSKSYELFLSDKWNGFIPYLQQQYPVQDVNRLVLIAKRYRETMQNGRIDVVMLNTYFIPQTLESV